MKLPMMEEGTIKIAAVGQQTASQHRIQHRHNSSSIMQTADTSGQTTADTGSPPLRHFHNSSTLVMTAQQPRTHHNTTPAWRPRRSEASQGLSSLCRRWYGPGTRGRSASRGSGRRATRGSPGSSGAPSTCQQTASSSPTWRGTSASWWMTTSPRRSVRTVIEVSQLNTRFLCLHVKCLRPSPAICPQSPRLVLGL